MTLLRNRIRRRRAFTLLEVLIAVMAFAIVLAAINTVLYGALRLRNRTSEAIERSFPVQQALAIIRRDLEGIVPPGGTIAGTFQGGPTIDRSGFGSLNLTMDRTDGPEIYTATGSVDDYSPWGDVQKVTYYLREPTNRVSGAGRDLVRVAARNLLAPIEDEPAEQRLLGNIESIQFEYFDGSDWLDNWDSTSSQITSGQSPDPATSNVLPKAIRVLIQPAVLESGGRAMLRTEARPLIELVVPVLVQGWTNLTQSTEQSQ